MKKRKRTFFRLLVISLVTTCCFSPPELFAETIRMAWATLPPHIYASEDGGPPAGPNIDLFNKIAEKMGYTVEWVGMPLPRITQAMKKGTEGIDGHTLTIKIPEWEKYALYPAKPYFSTNPCIAVEADNPLQRIKSVEDIDGYRIGFAATFTNLYPPIIMQNKNRLILDEISGNDWTQRNISRMLMGRLDAAFELNSYSILYVAKMLRMDKKIKILSLPSKKTDYYHVFFKTSPKAQKLLKAYEKVVADYKFSYDEMLIEEITKRTESCAFSTAQE